MVTVFHSILNQMKFHLVQNRKENCHHDYILFNLKGNENLVFSVYSGRESGVSIEDVCLKFEKIHVSKFV